MSASAEAVRSHIRTRVPEQLVAPVEPAVASERKLAVTRRPSESGWIIPFFLTLAGALAIFVWQMSLYTTLFG